MSHPDMADVLADLNVERYSRSVWWSRPVVQPDVLDDSPGRCAMRRAAMETDFDRLAHEVVA